MGHNETITKQIKKTTKINIMEEGKAELEKHIGFTDTIFKELQDGYDVVEQTKILIGLYTRLRDKYQNELEHNLKCVDDLKQKLSVLEQVAPTDNQITTL